MKPGTNDALWMLTGAAILLLLMLMKQHYDQGRDPAEQLAFKARRVDLVGQMQLALASASEAEKSAVMAVTDRESQTFADEARAATARVVEQRRELEELLESHGTQPERELLAQFSQAFTEFQRVDSELLDLAVTNTNVKAYALAFGPAAVAIDEMSAALSRLVAANADSPDSKTVMLLAFGAQISALRIQALLTPHIAEEGDQKMDELEASMTTEDEQVHKDLDGLAALTNLHGDADRSTAASSYARFGELRAQILTLSRQNTNVRSLAISLNQKRRVMLSCQAALNALQQAILEEPIAGLPHGRAAPPR